MYKIKSNLVAALFLVIGYSATAIAQAETVEFTLEEAQNYAIENSYMSINANKDVQIADKKVLETIGTGLPQINATANYQQYVQTPLSLIPASAFGGPEGEFAEVFLGTEQQMGLGLRADQLIFNGSYIVGLQAAKTYLQLSKNDKKKTDIEVKNMVTVAYGNALVAMKNVEILKGNSGKFRAERF